MCLQLASLLLSYCSVVPVINIYCVIYKYHSSFFKKSLSLASSLSVIAFLIVVKYNLKFVIFIIFKCTMQPHYLHSHCCTNIITISKPFSSLQTETLYSLSSNSPLPQPPIPDNLYILSL